MGLDPAHMMKVFEVQECPALDLFQAHFYLFSENVGNNEYLLNSNYGS